MNAAWQFEDSALDQAITALCIVPIQFGIGVVWAVWQVVKFAFAMFVWLFTAASESRQQVAMLAGLIVGAVGTSKCLADCVGRGYRGCADVVDDSERQNLMAQYYVTQVASHEYGDAQGYNLTYIAYDCEDRTDQWSEKQLGSMSLPAEFADWRKTRRPIRHIIRGGWG